MRRWTLTVLGLALLGGGAAAQNETDAPDAIARELRADLILRALVDELERSSAELKLAEFDRPYFIEYGLTDLVQAAAQAELGALTSSNQGRSRPYYTDVRVGSYELDNSNFGGGYGGYYGELSASVPIEDDYQAIRQAFWWTTDRDYKGVVETLARKKALMESKLITDKPPDFSRELPVRHLEPRLAPELDLAALEELATALSAVFRDYPDVQRSFVGVSAWGGNKYMINTEGTRLRTAVQRCSLSIGAMVQADDGMPLGDSLTLNAATLAELPPRAELEQRCRKFAEQLIAVKNAPLLESYSGPVLFEPKAAAELFAAWYTDNFSGGQRPLGSGTSPDDFVNKLNKRILPRFLDVLDDPSQREIAGVPALGHYRYDDQGVSAQAVTLVEDGRLKNLLMSRLPSKEFPRSNGHGRGSFGGARAEVGCLLVKPDPGVDAAGLRQELLEAASDEGLEFAIRIAALGGGNTPLLMYKVYADGREELVRGAEIADIDLKTFKRMLAAGDTLYVHNTGGLTAQTVAAPAMLFEELDLAKVDRDFDKPPILPSPLTRSTTP